MKRPKVLLLAVLLLPLVALAQNVGSAVQPTSTASTTTIPPAAATSTAPAVPSRATSTTPRTVPRATTLATTTRPASTTAIVHISPAFPPLPSTTTPAAGSSGLGSLLLWLSLAALAILASGFLLVQYIKNKKQNYIEKGPFEKALYKGTVIVQSLISTNVLDKIQVEKTFTAGDWTLQNVLIDEWHIPELAKSLKDGPWQVRLWKPGSDDIKIVFKNKVFDIKRSDQSTWGEATAYGLSKGIAKEQLDFALLN